jgi:hypothetical protein
MKHALRHQQSRRLVDGRWRPATGSTAILEAMLKALARQQADMAAPASSSQSQLQLQSQFPDHHDRGQPRHRRNKGEI